MLLNDIWVKNNQWKKYELWAKLSSEGWIEKGTVKDQLIAQTKENKNIFYSTFNMTIIMLKNMPKRMFSFSSDIVHSDLSDLHLIQLLKCLSFIKRVRVKEYGWK